MTGVSVEDALQSRYTCRAFRSTAVPRAVVAHILAVAGRAPSSGNLQPQWVWAMSGAPLAALIAEIVPQVRAGTLGDGHLEYPIFPAEMKEPYASRRFQVGADMYAAIDGASDGLDPEAQIRRNLIANYQLFGAPVGLFLAVDRDMGLTQWADLGMYVMAVMLLARSHGLHAAALQSWALWPRTVARHTGMPANLMLYCAMALGHADEEAPINAWRARREPLDAFATLRGFDP